MNSLIRTFPWAWLPTLILMMALCHVINVLTALPWWLIFPLGIAGTSGLLWLGLGHQAHRRYRKTLPLSMVPLCLWAIYIFLSASFGSVDLGAIFFHLQAGVADHGGDGQIVAAMLYVPGTLSVLLSLVWLTRQDSRFRRVEPLIAVVLLASNPLIHGIGQRSIAMLEDDNRWLDARYQPPSIISTDNPPNLLILYLESIERTYAAPRFGDAYEALSEIGQDGVVFDGVQQIDNTGWTMAGMIASQCGTPLIPAGVLHDSQLDTLPAIAPGIRCLGDLLSDQGYRLSFLGGASTDFAGKGRFYEGHGFDHVKGLEDLRARLEDPTYVNEWGLFDDSLYDATFDEVKRLDSQGDGPWGVVNLSLTGHAPNGFPAQSCRRRQGDWNGEDILYSVKCSATLARDFLDRLEAEGLLDNTLVVVLSDHLAMRVSVWDQLTSLERDNTFILLGEHLTPGRISRNASMLDVFPTLLDAMGLLEGRQAGLGVSLLDEDKATLLERHGKEKINQRLVSVDALQQRIWKGLNPKPSDEASDKRL